MPNITLAQANEYIARGIEAAEAAGLKLVFTVYDSGANLVSFARMDGAWFGSNELAQAKARTSAMFQMPNDALAEPLELGKVPLQFDHVHFPPLLLVAGGMPILGDDGALIGALGVSGGTAEQDGGIARIAVAEQ